jgi:hypoxanthine phosphoribosyltransferase
MIDITNFDDVIDSRDILEYIEKYKDVEDFEEKVKALQSIVEEYCDNYTDGLEDLKFGVFFIRDSYFEEYMSDYFFEVNQVDEALECYIDIEAFARDQQYDYASVNFRGIDYWYRRH